MGDSQVYGVPPSYAILFDRPGQADDAFEAVKSLPSSVNQEHVRKILAEAKRGYKFAEFIVTVERRDAPAARREISAALQTLQALEKRFPTPSSPPFTAVPPFMGETVEFLRGIAAALARAFPEAPKRPGRKTMPYYQKALKDLRSIGVGRLELAKALLRGSIPVPGPSPGVNSPQDS
jgi:hypothetical protein